MKNYRWALAAAGGCFAISFGWQVSPHAQSAPAATPAAQSAPAPAMSPSAADDPRPVLNKYCVTCHNSRMKTGGLALDAVDTQNPGDHAEIFEKVIRKLRTGAMPPAGRPHPDKPVVEATVAYFETSLDKYAAAHPNPGRPALHRLNRVEYANAIRDLMGIDIDGAALLPADNAAYGFDNVADALGLSPALSERYMGAAAKISQMALAHERETPSPDTIFVPTDRDQGTRVSDDLPFGTRGGLAVRYYFPVDGEYTFQVRLKEEGAGGGIMGLTDEPQQLEARIDQKKVWDVTVGGPDPNAPARGRGARGGAGGKGQGAGRAGGPNGRAGADPADPNLRPYRRRTPPNTTFKVNVTAGEHLVETYFVNKTTAVVEDLFDPSVRREPYRNGNGEPAVSSVTIAAPPADAAAAPSADSPSRRLLMVCKPAGEKDESLCARQIVSTLARRAYRRPVTDEDLQFPMKMYAEGRKRADFESGIDLAVRSILVSPNFLFRFESQPASAAADAPYRVSDIDLASRLSFFLWSSIPDDELLSAAEKKTLHTPAVLQAQVKRMLADPKSSAIVENFAGQWLHTRNVAAFRPSPELLFHFDDNLRQAFQTETEMFFESIMRENRSVLDLLDADYTFLNERLAKHYGIPGVYGERFRRVSLPADSPRRGLLGQGSILTDTSRPNRTSPVIRGKWILENIFGAPPPPPPPNVNTELKDTGDPHKVLPMREQMAQHRANPVCAACHAQMDQLGFALENFDAIGEWRDSYAPGVPVDAAAQLPDGTKFNGPTDLRKVLLTHSDEFVTTLTEKMLVYALGRGLDASDMPAVRQIKRDAAKTNYRFGSIVQGIVTSTPFQMRLAQNNSN